MGVLTDIFISCQDDAARYNDERHVPGYERAEYKRLTPLEFATLWAILDGHDVNDVELVMGLMDQFEQIQETDGTWTHQFPAALIARLARLHEAEKTSVAERWAATAEIDCDPHEICPVIDDLVRLARRAEECGKGLYVWNCL
jgi:hypothetical protein